MRYLTAALMVTVATMVQPAFADEHATMDEAKAMSVKAAAYVQDHGRDEGIKAFMAPGGQWHDRDLYVFMSDRKGVNIAHGVNPALVGKNLTDLQDVTGKYLVKEFLDIKTEGWVEYLWENPKSKEIESKSSYIVRINDGGLVGVGAYKQ